MELIQNWNITDQDKLLSFIINNINCDYTDIIICGSRIFGGFTSNSDIDVVVLLNIYKNNPTILRIFNDVLNNENSTNYFNVSITFKDYSKFENNTWKDLKYVYNLPYYSILNRIFYSGNNNHILHHQRLRELIKECRGMNVPFDKFNLENSHLL